MDAQRMKRFKELAYRSTRGLWRPTWATDDDMIATALLGLCEYAAKVGSFDVDNALAKSVMRRRVIDHLRHTGDYYKHKDPEVVRSRVASSVCTQIEWVDENGRLRTLESVARMVDLNAEAPIERAEQEEYMHQVIKRNIKKHGDYRAASMVAMTLGELTQADIGRIYGVTESRVSQILKKVLS